MNGVICSMDDNDELYINWLEKYTENKAPDQNIEKIIQDSLKVLNDYLSTAGKNTVGSHENLNYEKFPKQGQYLGAVVNVVFHYDTTKKLLGRIVRDDAEAPHETIIKLENGKYVRSSECQYNFLAHLEPRGINMEVLSLALQRVLDKKAKNLNKDIFSIDGKELAEGLVNVLYIFQED